LRLWELADVGEDIDQIAASYELPDDQVRAAVAYEEQLRSPAAERQAWVDYAFRERGGAGPEDWCATGFGFGSRSWRGALSAPIQTPRLVGGMRATGPSGGPDPPDDPPSEPIDVSR
jgi:hypothetical protein